MTKKRDLEIIEHAINVSHTHGGSINLHKAFQFVHGLFSKKKSKPKESEPVYHGYDPKSTKAPPHESTYTKKPEEPKKAPKYEEPKQEYTKPKPEPKREYKQSYPEYKKPEPEDTYKPIAKTKATGRDYQILGLSPNASLEEAKRAYRKSALLNHPDKGGDPEKMREIDEAFDRISGRGLKKRKYVRKHK
jgi:outer membrane biosynthesis protein TonB